MNKLIIVISFVGFIMGCASTAPTPKAVKSSNIEQAIIKSAEANADSTKSYKRKLAIARFNNESNYGRALLSEEAYGKIGRQCSDMLASKLVRSNKFIVIEKADFKEITPKHFRSEIDITVDKKHKSKKTNMTEPVVAQKRDSFSDEVSVHVGADLDTIIVGSVTEFGRSNKGKQGFLNSTKIQTARAKVEIRLIDAKTGHAYFSAVGIGEASTETGEVVGFGNRASYDATLNDRALGAAISDLLTDVVSRLESRAWKCAVLKIDLKTIYISGGENQGVKVGDSLVLMKYGEKVNNPQTGFDMRLPATKITELKVISLFGDDEFSQGAVCLMAVEVSGLVNNNQLYFVTE